MKRITLAALSALAIALPTLAATYYASPTGGGDGSTAASPETLPNAVGLAVNAGDEVVLLDGTYPLTSQITINRDITVRGTSRDGTIVQRSSGSIRLFELNSSGAVLSTMTVSDGYNVNGANVLINTGGGTVTNCVLRNGYRKDNGTGGAAACLYSGLLTHCLITNNLTIITQNAHSGGAVWFRKGSTAKMSHCIVADNVSRCNLNYFVGAAGVVNYDSTSVIIENCTFAYNRGIGGGAIYTYTKNAVTITNCLFTGNVAVRSSKGNRDYLGSYKSITYCSFDADATSSGTAHGFVGNNAIDEVTFAPKFDSVAVGAAVDGSDLGAVPCPAVTGLKAYAEVAQTRHAAPFAASLTAHASVAGATCTWNFGDGDTATSAPGLQTHTYMTP